METLFTKVTVESLHENFFKLINSDWMLITAGTLSSFNTMTASWGTTGILWNKPIAICFIRPHRYTFGFADRHDYFTLSFFGNQYRETLNFCGKVSGRDTDKVKHTGLNPLETPHGGITFKEASMVLECRKLYADFLKEEHFLMREIIGKNYPRKDFHKFFIGEIEGCYKRF